MGEDGLLFARHCVLADNKRNVEAELSGLHPIRAPNNLRLLVKLFEDERMGLPHMHIRLGVGVEDSLDGCTHLARHQFARQHLFFSGPGVPVGAVYHAGDASVYHAGDAFHVLNDERLHRRNSSMLKCSEPVSLS